MQHTRISRRRAHVGWRGRFHQTTIDPGRVCAGGPAKGSALATDTQAYHYCVSNLPPSGVAWLPLQ